MPTTALQAAHHRLIGATPPDSPEEHVLSLIFRKAYEHAGTLLSGPVLDVGCNTGYGTAILREHTACEVVGVDVSPRAIGVARERYGGDFRLVDGSILPFEDGQFGTVTSFQVIEHVEDTERYLREIRRVLRPGGIALFTTPNAAIRLDPGQRPWYRFHVREYRPEELRETLQGQFEEVEVYGLFGSSAIEAVERPRVARLRAAGRIRARVAWMLPLPVEDRLVRAVKRARRLFRAPPVAEQTSGLTTDDLFYSDVELTTALDLLAVCARRSP